MKSLELCLACSKHSVSAAAAVVVVSCPFIKRAGHLGTAEKQVP